MQFRAKDIAEILNGEIVGNPDKVVSEFSKIEEAQPNSIAFFANELYAKYLQTTKAGILLVSREFESTVPQDTTLIKVDDPYRGVAVLLEKYQQAKQIHSVGIEDHSVVSSSATLGDNTYVASFAYISDRAIIGNNTKVMPHCFIGKNVKIGDNTTLHSGVKIYDDCVIGNNCTIHSGTVIGGDGFGFARDENGRFKKIPQIGNVVIEDDVEIGCNTTIDRATMGSTLIKNGTILDNLIQIGHNVVIGKNTALAAMAGVAGSAKIGDNVVIGGLTGIKGHITVGDNVMINACSGVWSNVEDGEQLTGNPAYDFKKMMRAFPFFKNLPDMARRIRNLEKKIDE